MIGHEERVELSGFEPADQLPDMGEIEIGVRPGPGIAPCAGVNADRPHKCAELELACRHSPISIVGYCSLGHRYEAGPRHRSPCGRLFCSSDMRRNGEFIPPMQARPKHPCASCR